MSDVRLALGDREQRIVKTVPHRGYLPAIAISERVAEGAAILERHRAHAVANGWQYAALAAQAPLGVALLKGFEWRATTHKAVMEGVNNFLRRV